MASCTCRNPSLCLAFALTMVTMVAESLAACEGLTTVTSPNLQGNQVVVSDGFASDLQHLIDCAAAQGGQLSVQSTSRCRNPDDALAVDDSDHALGMATDANPVFNGQVVSREQMSKAWCAFHPTVSDPCQAKYGPNIPSQNALNNKTYTFLKCANQDAGLSLGVTYKGKTKKGKFKQDGNHFQRGPYSQAAKDSYQQLLKQYCNGQCPNVPMTGSAGQYACDCSGYSSTPTPTSLDLCALNGYTLNRACAKEIYCCNIIDEPNIIVLLNAQRNQQSGFHTDSVSKGIYCESYDYATSDAITSSAPGTYEAYCTCCVF